MKTYCYLGLIMLLCIQWTSANNNDTSINLVSRTDKRIKLIEMAGRRLKLWWTSYVMQEETKDTFMGRCFGVAKKLRMIIPIIIFKLGAIMTILGFLTLFSLKSIALLGLLLLINTSGAVAKVATALSHKDKDEHRKPQNIHLHLHQSKDGYHMDSSSYGFDDRIAKADSDDKFDRIETYNLYNKLIRNPYLRNYRSIDR